MWGTMQDEMLENSVQEAVYVFLWKMLCNMPVCASGDLWEQAAVPLLQ